MRQNLPLWRSDKSALSCSLLLAAARPPLPTMLFSHDPAISAAKATVCKPSALLRRQQTGWGNRVQPSMHTMGRDCQLLRSARPASAAPRSPALPTRAVHAKPWPWSLSSCPIQASMPCHSHLLQQASPSDLPAQRWSCCLSCSGFSHQCHASALMQAGLHSQAEPASGSACLVIHRAGTRKAAEQCWVSCRRQDKSSCACVGCSCKQQPAVSRAGLGHGAARRLIERCCRAAGVW